MDTSSVSSLSLTVLIIAAIVPLGVLVLAIILLATGRGEPDTTGRRPLTIYLSAVNFVAIFTIVFASFAMVSSLTGLITKSQRQTSIFSTDDNVRVSRSSNAAEDAAVRGAVQAGLVVGAAVVVLVFHARRRRELLSSGDVVAGGPAWRIDRSYLYAICFVAVLVALFSLGLGAYNVFRLAAPGVSNDLVRKSVERKDALATLLSLAYLGLATVYVFVRAWRQVGPVASDSRPTSPGV